MSLDEPLPGVRCPKCGKYSVVKHSYWVGIGTIIHGNRKVDELKCLACEWSHIGEANLNRV